MHAAVEALSPAEFAAAESYLAAVTGFEPSQRRDVAEVADRQGGDA